MASPFRKIADVITGKFSLADIPGFPFEVYTNQLSVYEEQENWFSGAALSDQIATVGAATDLYPLRINPTISTVLKHAYMLFGETVNDGRPLVFPTMIPEDDSEEATKRAEAAEEAIYQLWWENNGRSLMFENGILSQIYGGCVFKASFVPWEWDKYGGWRKIPIRIERVNPKSFVGRPMPGDMFRLKEAWIVSDIPLEEAKKWGYTGVDDSPTFVEYWSDTKHKMWINNQDVALPLAIPDGGEQLAGTLIGDSNPFGFVPVVYIPHIRTGGFHGVNAFDHLKGIIKEINLRFGDYGDAVNEDSHVPLAMKNVVGSPVMKRVGEGIKVLDLGTSNNVTGNESDPDIFELHKGRASAAMGSLLGELISQYRRDSSVPAVAEGEDEGSQRSALTLATRFWPLTSHVGIERIFFGTGMDVFENYLLRMMAVKDIAGITKQHSQLRMKQSWAPMLPRDREAEVQEWQSRAQNNLGSVEHLLELTRDVDDISDEREKILKWIEDVARVQAEAEAKAVQKYPPPVTNPFGGKDPSNPNPGPKPAKTEKTPTEKRGGGGGD